MGRLGWYPAFRPKVEAHLKKAACPPRNLPLSKLFDPEGLFIGDGSYLFVPDNENYEGSDVLLFDEHNHPVDPQQVDLKDKRYQWRRCYKLVSLIHINRELDLFLTVAARLTGGRPHECPILYELVDGFVNAVGRDWMKVLILDRGFLDGAQIGRLKSDYRIDTVIPLRTNMDAYHDVMGLTRRKDFGWEPYQLPVARFRGQKDRPKPPVILKRERKRQQTLAARKGLPPPPLDQQLRRLERYLRAADGSGVGICANFTSFFDSALLAVGVTDAMYRFKEDRAFLERVMDALLDHQEMVMREVCRRFASDLAFVLINDDIAYNSGLFIRPDVFLEIFPRRMRRLMAPAKEAGKLLALHTDGRMKTILPVLAKLGFDIVHPIEPKSNDIFELKQE